MFPDIDIRVVGVIGILILLVIGYFVYLLYQDLVFLKKEVLEVKTIQPIHSHEEDWVSEVEDENTSELTEEEQDAELERHLASFMESRQLHPIIEEYKEEPEIQMEDVTKEEPEQEIKIIKKRGGKKKKVEIVEENNIEYANENIEV